MGRVVSWVSGIFRHLLCISLSCLNLLKVKVASSCSAGQGTVLQPLMLLVLSVLFLCNHFCFSSQFPWQFLTVSPHYAVQHNLKKKKVKFSLGSDVKLFRMKMKIWLASLSWQKGEIPLWRILFKEYTIWCVIAGDMSLPLVIYPSMQ